MALKTVRVSSSPFSLKAVLLMKENVRKCESKSPNHRANIYSKKIPPIGFYLKSTEHCSVITK